MELEVLCTCMIDENGVAKWHDVISLEFEPGLDISGDIGRIFVHIAHSPDTCGMPEGFCSTVPIWETKGFRETFPVILLPLKMETLDICQKYIPPIVGGKMGHYGVHLQDYDNFKRA